jgi:hypothetical protein
MFLRNFLIWEFRSLPPPPRCCCADSWRCYCADSNVLEEFLNLGISISSSSSSLLLREFQCSWGISWFGNFDLLLLLVIVAWIFYVATVWILDAAATRISRTPGEMSLLQLWTVPTYGNMCVYSSCTPTCTCRGCWLRVRRMHRQMPHGRRHLLIICNVWGRRRARVSLCWWRLHFYSSWHVLQWPYCGRFDWRNVWRSVIYCWVCCKICIHHWACNSYTFERRCGCT